MTIEEAFAKYGPPTDRFIIRLGKQDGEFEAWHCTKEDFQEDFEGFLDALSLTRSVRLTTERMKDQKAAKRTKKKEIKAAAKEVEKIESKKQKEAAKVARRAEKALEKEMLNTQKKAERAAVRAQAVPVNTDAEPEGITEVETRFDAAITEAVTNAIADNRLAGLPPVSAAKLMASLPVEEVTLHTIQLPKEN